MTTQASCSPPFYVENFSFAKKMAALIVSCDLHVLERSSGGTLPHEKCFCADRQKIRQKGIAIWSISPNHGSYGVFLTLIAIISCLGSHFRHQLIYDMFEKSRFKCSRKLICCTAGRSPSKSADSGIRLLLYLALVLLWFRQGSQHNIVGKSPLHQGTTIPWEFSASERSLIINEMAEEDGGGAGAIESEDTSEEAQQLASQTPVDPDPVAEVNDLNVQKDEQKQNGHHSADNTEPGGAESTDVKPPRGSKRTLGSWARSLWAAWRDHACCHKPVAGEGSCSTFVSFCIPYQCKASPFFWKEPLWVKKEFQDCAVLLLRFISMMNIENQCLPKVTGVCLYFKSFSFCLRTALSTVGFTNRKRGALCWIQLFLNKI